MLRNIEWPKTESEFSAIDEGYHLLQMPDENLRVHVEMEYLPVEGAAVPTKCEVVHSCDVLINPRKERWQVQLHSQLLELIREVEERGWGAGTDQLAAILRARVAAQDETAGSI